MLRTRQRAQLLEGQPCMVRDPDRHAWLKGTLCPYQDSTRRDAQTRWVRSNTTHRKCSRWAGLQLFAIRCCEGPRTAQGMSRSFNVAGPSVPGEHYMIDPLVRLDLPEIENLIAAKRYFLLHAPRQTGKTTALLALMHHLNMEGGYRACYANIEGAQTARHDVARGMRTVCDAISRAANEYLGDDRLRDWTEDSWAAAGPDGALTGLLERWSKGSDHPIVLMLDEVDALVGDTLVSLLRQIRAGYAQRPAAFPQTVILCGVRDIQDYRIHTSHQEIITGGSAFNIKAESLRLGNFSRDETEALWRQHQEDTGQHIDSAIWPELWEDTQGQPWLVNALGLEVTWKERELRDRSQPITLERYHAARERLIQSRATHLDQLTDKLREERVRRIVADILGGEAVDTNYPPDDLQYAVDLGLIVTRPHLRIANRIYQEVIPRELTWPRQVTITHQTEWYVRADHRLDLPKLLTAFQQFFREHSEAWLDSFKYKEAGPQLLMQAFLQRVVNGGGRITREYAMGSRRTDLFLQWPVDKTAGFNGPVQKVVIELKLLRKSPEITLAKGLEQTAAYADKSGADEAYLILFDRRNRSWDECIWKRTESQAGRQIGVWGM
jgi:hypothetical protein